MNFDASVYPYGSHREVVYGRRGMVCTSQTLASQAGLDMLKKGGNAIDAAVATAICLTVLEPTSNGLGSDAFALIWTQGKLYGINGSGWSPAGLTRDELLKRGYDQVPLRGWEPVMVPGAPATWAEVHRRFGRLPFEDLFEPAIAYARDGYAVMPNLAAMLADSAKAFVPYKGKKLFQELFDTFFPHGRAPKAGDILKLPDLAKSLELLRDSHCQALYDGELADAIDAWSRETGGLIRKDDLAVYRPQWVDPIHTSYRGYDVWEMPPNGHGLVVLMALDIASGFIFSKRDEAEVLHRQIEAMKLAFCDGKQYIADPCFMKTSVDEWLSPEYADRRRALIADEALLPEPIDVNCGGTVYLCSADGEGNMVSFIQSNYNGFGSGIVVPGYGISLSDRGHNFSMDLASANCVGPRKKSYHTIIPGFLTKDGSPVGPFGVMGAFMQPQGQFQVLLNTIDYHLNPQTALDAPRWQWVGGKTIEMERAFPTAVVEELRRRGHDVVVKDDIQTYGRGQIIWRDEQGTLIGGTEPRADGGVAAW
ncbi:gamma-glutamyltransferase family protein [Megasphaera elsdenii]|uniref:gamma-glutamyltransferase family protein n=1 Tax=Megasphaera elsdenii TaxID=907 RepID=UPI002E778EB3|nr:gamma-glutamyltransferase family protein [Megasphaera elsdenii]MEE0404461.1 gamma-glutamyltransferase family protein [Megasphaera elsdenii]